MRRSVLLPIYRDAASTSYGGGTLSAFGEIGYRIPLGKGEIEPFAVDRNALVAEAGVDWQPTEALSIGLSAAAQIGPRARTQTLKGNLVWRF